MKSGPAQIVRRAIVALSLMTDKGAGADANGNLTSVLDVVSGRNVVAGSAAGGFKQKEGGAAGRMGLAVLVGGTLLVATTAVTANSRIFLTSQLDGGAPGFLRVTARVVGASFTITSSNGADTSSVAWLIVEPA